MKFLTILPATLALALVLALAWGASAQDGPLVPPDDPRRPASPVASPGSPTPVPRPSQPTAEPVDDGDEPATPSPTPATPTSAPPAPEPPATPATPPGEQDDAPWAPIGTIEGAWIGVVTSETLNIRQAPSLAAPIIGTSWAGHLVAVYEDVAGDAVDGNTTWYRVGPEQFVSAALIDAFVPPAPPAAYDGHWVDIDLSAFYAIAYDGVTPVYAAIIRSGKPGYETPTGVFTIQARVRSETMDAGTLGVAPGDPEYYYIPDVPYTQYFAAGGYALHGNDWTDPAGFGRPGSHGCVNLLEADAAWFWDFLATGSIVQIHA
jgi:hypothetical protein